MRSNHPLEACTTQQKPKLNQQSIVVVFLLSLLLLPLVNSQCTIGTFSSQATVADFTYKLGTGAKVIPTTFVQSASDCNRTWQSITILQGGLPVTFAPITHANNNFKIESIDSGYIGVHTGVTLSATVDKDTAGTSTLTATSNSFTLTI